MRDVIDPGISIAHPDTTVRQVAGLINDFKLDGVTVVAAGRVVLALLTPAGGP